MRTFTIALLPTALLLAAAAPARTDGRPIARDPEREALQEIVRWPNAPLPAVMAPAPARRTARPRSAGRVGSSAASDGITRADSARPLAGRRSRWRLTRSFHRPSIHSPRGRPGPSAGSSLRARSLAIRSCSPFDNIGAGGQSG